MTEPITISTLLWSANSNSHSFSAMYDESWVDKLYRGVKRNITRPFEFILYTDKYRMFGSPIQQRAMRSRAPTYGDCLQPYELDRPMILMGLDTIICGNIDHLADYCFEASELALPRDPYQPYQCCNGVALVPGGFSRIWDEWAGDELDMERVSSFPHVVMDDIWPNQVVSYKGFYQTHRNDPSAQDVRIVYFHGEQKPHQLPSDPLVIGHWF